MTQKGIQDITNKMICSSQNLEVFALVGVAAIFMLGLIAFLYLYTRRDERLLRKFQANLGYTSHQTFSRDQHGLTSQGGHQDQERQEQSYIASLENKDEELQKYKKEKEDASQKLQNKERELQNIRTEKERIQARLQDQDHLEGRLQRLQAELESEREEKEEALRRLSAIMSSRLKDGNPNVVDLNDQNRPTKIGEKFSELYDNQWTNAYAAMEKYFGDNDEQIINILLQILKLCFKQCSENAAAQLDNFEKGINTIAGNIASKSRTLRNDIMQRLKEERKAFALDCIPDFESVWQKVATNFSGYHESMDFLHQPQEMKAYLEECLTLCWYMAIQDPPMVIISEPGDNPNQLFRAYMTSGPYAKFVVWPALLLTDQGSLVMKGTAEFTKHQ